MECRIRTMGEWEKDNRRERERQLRKVIRPSPLVRQADTPSVVVVRNKQKRRNVERRMPL